MLTALAFVPVPRVSECFEAFDGSIPERIPDARGVTIENPDGTIENPLRRDLLPLLDYFEDNYLGRRRGNGRRPPLFAVYIWYINIFFTFEIQFHK